jgi:hypothetical protein
MSFAINAAPVNNDENFPNISNDSDNYLNKKRQTHNKTQKVYPKENFDTEKVNSVLEKIHNSQKTDDNDDNGKNLGDFNPPPKPESSGVNKTVATEQMMNMTNQNDLMFRTLGRAPQPNYQGGDNLDLNDYTNYGDNKSAEEYYKKVLPGYNKNPNNNSNNNQVNKLYHSMNHNVANNQVPSQDVLLQKLNYMISLLEDQQDEKTNNVTEEVILYSFLGIFIIFVVDSFAKVGKYVR